MPEPTGILARTFVSGCGRGSLGEGCPLRCELGSKAVVAAGALHQPGSEISRDIEESGGQNIIGRAYANGSARVVVQATVGLGPDSAPIGGGELGQQNVWIAKTQ